MNFQQRLVWTFVVILCLNFIGWWASALFGVDISKGPDPSQVFLGIIGLITTIVGGAEMVGAARRKTRDMRDDANDKDAGG